MAVLDQVLQHRLIQPPRLKMDVEAAAEMDVEDSKDDLLKDIVVVDVAEQAESMDTDMF